MESEFGHDPASGARWEIHGPAAGIPVVEAWADDYIRFDGLPPWQEELRDEIRRRCGLLEPAEGQVLQASVFGPKPFNADVENLVLYNIGSFAVAGRNGIRFEHGVVPPPAPSGATYRFCYRYALVPRCRTLASFDCDWIDLGVFSGEKKLAQVWLALARGLKAGKVKVFMPEIEADTAFAVNIEIRPPRGTKYVLGNLVKPIFDGVISGFQAHADLAVLPEVLPIVAKQLQVDPEEIRGHLLDQRRAVLGTVSRLVAPYGAGVKWYPSDHWCMAGELLAADPADDNWAIKGKVVELSR
jgi:hypothetical protein